MARRTLGVAVVLVLVASLAWGGESGRLAAVTVYRRQAAVTRVVPVPAGAGPMEVVVTSLPAQAVPSSLHADGGAGVQIRAVRHRVRTIEAPPPEGVGRLDDELAKLDAPLREIQQKREVLTRKQAFLEKLGSFSAGTTRNGFERGAVTTDELSKLTTFMFDEHDKLAQALLALVEQERKLDEQKAAIARQRAALTAGRSRTVREAVVFLEKQREAAGELRLGYLVEGVEWWPSYNLRAATGGERVELEYNATVRQTSGEDWTGVALTLSTASPALSSDPPSLAPFRVTLDSRPESRAAHDTVRAERERRAAEEQFRSASSEEGRERATAVANTAAARLNVLYLRGSPRLEEIVPDAPDDGAAPALAVSYPLEGPRSLASRDDLQTLRIALLKLDAAFYRLAQPTLTRHVYRQAQMTNASDTVLLAGKMNAYLDGRFAGTGDLPMVRPGQRVVAGLGVDPRLVAAHKLLQRDETVKGGNRELTLRYEILLENFSDAPLAVRVLDRFPMPAADKIYVALLKTQVPLSADPAYLRFHKPRNVLRWDVEVPARATEDGAYSIEYQYSVGFAKNLELRAGRTIMPFFALATPLEPWQVAEDWSKDQTTILLAAGKPGEPEQVTVGITRGRQGKNAIGRRVEGDLSRYRWLVVDLHNKIAAGTRVALGLSTGKEWAYYESPPCFVQAGENPNVVFDLTAPKYKTEAKGWKYDTRAEHLDDVRSLYLVFYPIASGQIVLRDIKLAK